MTEAEWLTCVESGPILDHIRSRASERKLGLFSFACFSRLDNLLPEPGQKRAVEAIERRAEGLLSRTDVAFFCAEARRAIPLNQFLGSPIPADDPHFVALMLYREFCSRSIAIHAVQATAGLADGATEQRQQAILFRDIVGNPFRPVVADPAWLTETAVGIARGIYDDRAFERLPILADALQEAGCEDADILAHCREPGTHVRGCWVVDLVLGKT